MPSTTKHRGSKYAVRVEADAAFGTDNAAPPAPPLPKKVRVNGECFRCDAELNPFNRMDGGYCVRCTQTLWDRGLSTRSAVMEQAGEVYVALRQADRVYTLVQGIDKLRDAYFRTKFVDPWLRKQEEERIAAEEESKNVGKVRAA